MALKAVVEQRKFYNTLPGNIPFMTVEKWNFTSHVNCEIETVLRKSLAS